MKAVSERRVCRLCGDGLVPSPCVPGLWLSDREGTGRAVCEGTGQAHQAWPAETLAADAERVAR